MSAMKNHNRTLMAHAKACGSSVFQWLFQNWQGYVGYRCEACDWECVLNDEGEECVPA